MHNGHRVYRIRIRNAIRQEGKQTTETTETTETTKKTKVKKVEIVKKISIITKMSPAAAQAVARPTVVAPVYLQIFVHGVYGINAENNYPNILFANKQEKNNWIRRLVPRQARRLYDEPCFVINNAQLNEVRRIYIDIDGREWDSCFSVRENLTQLREVNIENNTLCEEGLVESLSTFI